MPQELPLEALPDGGRARVAVYGPEGVGKTAWRRRLLTGEMRAAAPPPTTSSVRVHLTGHVRGRDRPLALHFDWTELQASPAGAAAALRAGYDAAICMLPPGCADAAAWLDAARAITPTRVVACVAARGAPRATDGIPPGHPVCSVDAFRNLRIDAPLVLLARALLCDSHAALQEPEPIEPPTISMDELMNVAGFAEAMAAAAAQDAEPPGGYD